MRKLFPLAALAAASIFVAIVPQASSKPETGTIGFQVPSVVDPIHTFGEPDIGFDSLGRVFVSGPTGTGTQRSAWLGSVDAGHTFRVITPGAPPTAIQGIEDPPGGGDTDLAFDRSGHQYFADLYALACLRVATTPDGGATVAQNILGCDGTPGADRQWLAVYDPAPGTPHDSAYVGPTPLVYLEYNNLIGPGPDGGAQWNKSNDGLTYTNATSGVTPATETTYSPSGPDGYPAIDQQTGKVFQAAGFPNGDGSYDLLLNIGTPDVLGDLTFLDAPATPGGGPNYANLIHIADGIPGSPDTLFSVASMDSARNLFVVWSVSPTNHDPAKYQVFVSAASAASGWRNWTKPVQVSDGSTATGDAVNVFPWLKAGGAGRADAVWYGSDKRVNPSSQSGQAWNVFMAQTVFLVDSTGAVTGRAPSVSLVKATPHPMHYNDICLQGAGCIASQGNRNLADFFQVNIDSTGAAEIVYDDTSNGLVQPGFTPGGNQSVDHAGAGVVSIARQSSGLGLFGTPVSGSSNSPAAGLSDPAGDARYPVLGGANVSGMDLVGSSLGLAKEGKTLDVTMRVVDARTPALTAASIAGATLLQYVTRWQLGNTLYYAAMSNDAANAPVFYAGKTQSVDLCSVSACFPHVLTYPEPGLGGTAETGSVSCPASPSATNPCSITVHVNVADVGGPTAKSLLEEVGGYAFAASHPQGATTNAQALADNVALEIDGVCCFNYQASKAKR